MTEQEWMECSDPIAMLIFLFGPFERQTDEVLMSRKNLLLACACFSRLWELIPPEARRWQEHAAQAAEGCYEKRNLHGEGEEADIELGYAMSHTGEEGKGRLRALLDLWTWTDSPEWQKDGSEIFWQAERKEQAAHIRDLFGNLFHPVTLDPSWLTPKVIALAQQIYDERAFDRLPILVNALEEAGCHNADILSHCRQQGEHVRGCWVVDLVLRKG
jgi:hypothetical protein